MCTCTYIAFRPFPPRQSAWGDTACTCVVTACLLAACSVAGLQGPSKRFPGWIASPSQHRVPIVLLVLTEFAMSSSSTTHSRAQEHRGRTLPESRTPSRNNSRHSTAQRRRPVLATRFAAGHLSLSSPLTHPKIPPSCHPL
ncbi:hypothetical protein BT67DRAFT_185883 [Trichocladium antarcticum]|uniref:Uncharacterized protein n=1 Tax=Trichocladium antarcticum TaxID=1450529 RepID=A0AAN6ZEY4_9PEZI|nr:hypothetical protein BT67DRAFT_185883 [Trichocladium antarcticum]